MLFSVDRKELSLQTRTDRIAKLPEQCICWKWSPFYHSFISFCCRSISKSVVDTTLEDKTKELMEESRMVLVQFSIDRVSLGVHSMGEALTFLVAVRFLRWSVLQHPTST